MYQLRFPTPSAEKRFDKTIAKIPNFIRQEILDKLESLVKNPKPADTGSFKRLNPPVDVFSLTAQYRLRVQNYRILYDVDETKKIVWILDLRKRNEKTYR